VELLALRGLVIQFVRQPEMLTSMVDGVRPGSSGSRRGAWKLTLDGDSLEVTAVSSEEQDLLVESRLPLRRPAYGAQIRAVRQRCSLESSHEWPP
jgi:hypothetical protein